MPKQYLGMASIVKLPVTAVAVLAALAGCGSETSTAPRGVAALDAKARPALARGPVKPGEVVLRGDASPRSHRGVALDGTYLVRFQQYAPEDPRLDFAGETPFVATLRGPTTVKLFHAAAPRGAKRVKLAGRYDVDVTFGDFPYVVRFTPVR